MSVHSMVVLVPPTEVGQGLTKIVKRKLRGEIYKRHGLQKVISYREIQFSKPVGLCVNVKYELYDNLPTV